MSVKDVWHRTVCKAWLVFNAWGQKKKISNSKRKGKKRQNSFKVAADLLVLLCFFQFEDLSIRLLPPCHLHALSQAVVL